MLSLDLTSYYVSPVILLPYFLVFATHRLHLLVINIFINYSLTKSN